MAHSTTIPSARSTTDVGNDGDDVCCKKKVSPQYLPVSHSTGDGLVDADNCETLNKMLYPMHVCTAVCSSRYLPAAARRTWPIDVWPRVDTLLIKISAIDAARCAAVGHLDAPLKPVCAVLFSFCCSSASSSSPPQPVAFKCKRRELILQKLAIASDDLIFKQ